MNHPILRAVLTLNKMIATNGLSTVRRLLTAAFFVLLSLSVSATVYNVTTTTDGNGANQLRGAIIAADAAGGTHTINVPAGTYNLTMGAIRFGNRAENITIVGAGSGSTIINMTTADRILFINPSGTVTDNIVISISGMKLQNADLNTDNFGGGAVRLVGPNISATFTQCAFDNNRINPARNSGGGAIRCASGGTLIIDQCSFTGNSVPGNSTVSAVGGAVFFQFFAYSLNGVPQYTNSNVSITNSTFTNNSVGSNSSTSSGGAIFISSSGGTGAQTFVVNIAENNFVNNSAAGSGKGGAIGTINSFAPGNTWNINYNRFVGNTASFGSALSSDDVQGNINATNNWWGCNSGPSSCADKAERVAGSSPGVLTATPYLQLRTSTANATLCSGTGTMITSGFTTNSAGTTIAASDLSAFTGVPISFSATLGTISGAQTTIQSTGTATATYTAGSTAGTGTVNAVVDNVPANDATARASVTINTAPTVTNPASATVCAGTMATFTVTGGGSGTLSYQWFKGATMLNNGATGTGSTISGAATATLTITNSGTSDAATNYNVRVSSTTGCGPTTSTNASLTVNALPGVTNPANASTCAGTPVSFSVTGSGSGTLSYQWFRGTTALVNGGSSSISGVTTATLTIGNPGTGDAATNYNVRVSSTTGCTPATSANASLTVSTAPSTPTVTVTQPSCSSPTGSITVTAPVGTGITYSINGTTYQSGTTFSGLAPGNYSVTARNSSNCTSASLPVTINAAPAVPATPTVSVTQPSCSSATGSITVSSPGGAGITYSIDGTNYQANNIFTNVAPGNYSVTAKNSSGCVSPATPATVNAQPPTPAAPMVSVTQPVCPATTGTITVNSPMGAGITYSINSTTYQSSNVFNNVAPGTYNVTAKNSDGCVSAATPATVNASPAAPAMPAVTVTQPSCTVATGTIVVNSPTGPTITYSINGTDYQAGTTFNNVAPGNYQVTAKNGTGCASAFTPVTINPQPATPATPTVMVTQPSCTAPAGSITVTAPSGAGITYSINGTTYQASNIFNNLTPGNYSVTAKNSSGCVSMATPVTINAAPTAGPAAPTVTVTQPTCSSPSGSITVTAPTGAGITYSINGTTYQAGTTFNNVSPGSYNVTAKNSSGCVSAATPVTINAVPADNQPPVIPTNLTVFLNANSQASVTPTSVAPLITDNCAVDPNSITVSANSFNCANITGSSTYQPFVATNSIGNQNADEEQGMDFRVNAASGIVITQLGAFDHQANGLMGTQPDGNGGMGIRVAIFNKANQMIVPGLDVVITGNGDAFSGNYRYKNIPAVTLPPGDYLVLAKGYNANELMGNVYLGGGPYPQGDNAGGAISFLNTAFYDGSATPGFTYPAQSVNTGTSNIFKGGTFTYALSQSNTVTISAADYAGNQSQVVANVMVVDTMYILATKNITVNLNSSGQATIQPKDVLQSYKNKCGIDVISSTLQVSPSSFTCSDVGAATLSSPHQPFIAINSTGNQNADEEQGMDFRVNAAGGIVITQLGAFDHQANGLMGTQPDGNGGMGIRVAIFNKANQMIVPGLDVVITGNGDAFAGNYRYKNIAAVTLPPGDYLVLAKGYNANELMGNVYLGGGPYPQGDDAGGAISYLNTAFYDGSATPGFTYPAQSVNTGTSNIFKGGTFTYKTRMAPGTLVTLTATDVYGNQKQATANVVVTDFNNVCTPAPIAASAKAAPVMAGKVSPAQQPKEQIEVEKLSIYPNPSQGAFNVQLSHVSGSKLSVEIRDGNGKVVAVKAVPLGSKTQTLTVPFDLGSQASGMYWIRVVSATGVQTTKVLLQR